ncbi:hypothetical protein AArcSl_2208 [Halalkaliarchaeum desulfuricum]|uniref:DNA polymerase sliding clamp n=1 Tax=Halalkaliarchaeum desulfuricum TaxID=2055893 RepID=A0A343TL60_9EURY|nr:hypothetical protein [Halalkaliarchaeum desulfuricum]AUX09832.1 hypothetical protein AArcSl_2208 [Halalkaliarchaeum desulfuricum]
MKVTLQAAPLRDALQPISEIINEALFIRRETELVITGLTPDRTASVTATVAIDDEPESAQEGAVGTQIQTLSSFLEILEASDPTTVTGPPVTERVTVETTDSQYRCYPYAEASVRTRDDSDDTPEHRVEAIFPMDSTPLARSLRAANLCGNALTIETRHDDPVVCFSAVGDVDSMEHWVSEPQLNAYDAGVCSVSYDINRLLTMYEAVKSRAAWFSLAIDAANTLVFETTHRAYPITTELRLNPPIDLNESTD